jgi:putative transposase
MCSLFRNKYRIEPCRLKGHDYSKGSRYFITICTQGKTIWFGNILNKQMILSESGQIAKKLWQNLTDHFSFVSLDEYVIMPDHVHGIIVINPLADDSVRQQPQPIQHTPINEFMSSISPKPGSLATVIRSYKSAVSKNIHLFDHGFSWQTRYYDHLIRSDAELERIRKYITDNPDKWDH